MAPLAAQSVYQQCIGANSFQKRRNVSHLKTGKHFQADFFLCLVGKNIFHLKTVFPVIIGNDIFQFISSGILKIGMDLLATLCSHFLLGLVVHPVRRLAISHGLSVPIAVGIHISCDLDLSQTVDPVKLPV